MTPDKTSAGKSSSVASLDKKRIEKAVEENEPCKETVIALLEEIVKGLKEGKDPSNKCVVIMLQDDDNYYFHQIYSAGMLPPEGIALTELAKDDFKELLYGDE